MKKPPSKMKFNAEVPLHAPTSTPLYDKDKLEGVMKSVREASSKMASATTPLTDAMYRAQRKLLEGKKKK